MKKNYFYPFILLTFVFNMSVFAQTDNENENDDQGDCSKMYNAFAQSYESEHYEQALQDWRLCFANCPKINKNLYINGAKVLNDAIKTTQDQSIKKNLIDTLLLLYDKRVEFFGEQGKVIGYKGEDIYRYFPQKTEEVYELLNKSISLENRNSRATVLSIFFKIVDGRYKQKQVLIEEALGAYGVVSDIINYNLQKDSTDVFYLAAKKEVDNMYTRDFNLDCAALTKLYGSSYESNQDNLVFLKRLKNLLDKRHCVDGDLYKQVEKNLIENDTTSESLEKMAIKYYNEGNIPKSSECYKKAIAKEKDKTRQAYLWFSLAKAVETNPTLAVAYCNNAIQASSSYARPYLLIAKLYASGANRCVKTASTDAKFSKKAMFWAATDKCEIAKTIDPKLTAEADELIATFAAQYPTVEELTPLGLQEGDSYSINCWVSTKTKVRAKK